jgi:hypothetical protein
MEGGINNLLLNHTGNMIRKNQGTETYYQQKFLGG